MSKEATVDAPEHGKPAPPPATSRIVDAMTWRGDTSHTLADDAEPAGGKPLDVGMHINGRYRVLRVIGHGGMGWVYDVADVTKPGLPVAMKIAHGLGARPALLSLFKAEFSTMTKLDHPNVTRVYDFEQIRGSADFLITMEKVDGEPINQALGSHDWRAVIEHAVQICRALSYVHSRHIVHFDLKPANILVDKTHNVKVVDFGISGAPRAQNGRMLGTPLYMPPELLLGEDGGDHRADLYSLGITIYELLFGEVPCPKRDLLDIISWISEGGVRVAPAANVPEWLASLIEKLCARDPADRPHNANAVLDAINHGSGSTYQFETGETQQSYITTPRFSGRAKEHEQVSGFLAERLDGRGREPVLMVSGVSGIGKSRLMKEVRQTAQLHRLVFLEANCYERSMVEYGPIADILYQLVPLVETLGGMDVVQDALPALVKMAPRLGHGRSFEASSKPTTAEGERALQLEAAAEFVVRASQLVPFAIYINDLQWAGRGSAELFSYIGQRVSDDEAQGTRVRVALLGTFRSDEVEGRPLESMLSTLGKRRLTIALELTPLDAEQVGEVVRSMLGIDAIPQEFLDRVAAETGGSPFFVQEVMRALLENGSVFLDQGKWATKAEIGGLQVPATMADVFRRRFNMLGAGEQAVVAILAVHGRPLQIERIAEVLGGDSENLKALLELERKTIVVKQVGHVVAYNISHDRMRETIYADLTDAERSGLHLRIGEKLEGAAAGMPESDKPLDELARHFRGARVDDKALTYSIAAGKLALQQFANDAATEHLGHALALMRDGDARFADILDAHANGLARLNQFGQALEEYRRVLIMRPDPLDSARVREKIVGIYVDTSQLEEGRDEAWEAAVLLGEKRPRGGLGWIIATLGELAAFTLARIGMPGLTPFGHHAHTLARLYYRLTLVYWFLTTPAMIYTTLRQWRLTARSPDPGERALHASVFGSVLGALGFLRLGRSLTEAGVRDAAGAGSIALLGGNLVRAEMVEWPVGHWRDGVDRLRRSCELCRKGGDLLLEGTAVVILSVKLLFSGEVEAARRCAALYSAKAFRLTESPLTAKMTLAIEAHCLARSSPTSGDRIDALFARAEEVATRARDPLSQIVVAQYKAYTLLLRGMPTEAVAVLEQSQALRKQVRDVTAYSGFGLFLLPRAYLRLPDLTRGQENALARVQKEALRFGKRFAGFLPPVLLNEALIREWRGKPREADHFFAKGLALARAHESGLFIAECLFEWALALGRRGETVRAVECLREAREISIRGGDVWFQQQCDAAAA